MVKSGGLGRDAFINDETGKFKQREINGKSYLVKTIKESFIKDGKEYEFLIGVEDKEPYTTVSVFSENGELLFTRSGALSAIRDVESLSKLATGVFGSKGQSITGYLDAIAIGYLTGHKSSIRTKTEKLEKALEGGPNNNTAKKIIKRYADKAKEAFDKKKVELDEEKVKKAAEETPKEKEIKEKVTKTADDFFEDIDKDDEDEKKEEEEEEEKKKKKKKKDKSSKLDLLIPTPAPGTATSAAAVAQPTAPAPAKKPVLDDLVTEAKQAVMPPNSHIVDVSDDEEEEPQLIKYIKKQTTTTRKQGRAIVSLLKDLTNALVAQGPQQRAYLQEVVNEGITDPKEIVKLIGPVYQPEVQSLYPEIAIAVNQISSENGEFVSKKIGEIYDAQGEIRDAIEDGASKEEIQQIIRNLTLKVADLKKKKQAKTISTTKLIEEIKNI